MTRSNPSRALSPALEFLQRLWRLDHALARLSSRMETRLGITAQQRLVIRCVGTCPRISPGQLAELMHVDPGTVSAALRRLERMGLLERHRDAVDRRRIALELTARGHSLDGPTTGTVEEAVTELLAGSPAEAVAVAMALIERLTTLLDDKAGR